MGGRLGSERRGSGSTSPLAERQLEIQYPIGTTLAEGSSIRWIRVSPKGDLVSFVDGDTISTVDRKGQRTVVSRGLLPSHRPVWSPRGDELILSGSRSQDQRAVYAVSLSGRERVLINLSPQLVLHDVAADGRLLIEYCRALQTSVCQRGGEDREREIALHDSWLNDISEDGRLILFVVPDELLLCKTDGTPAIHLGRGEAQGLSADGRWVLAILKGPPRELVLVPTGPGTAKRTPIEEVEPQYAALLPNGKGFLVGAKGKGQSNFDLFLVGPDGGKPKPIRTEGWAWDEGLVVSPDGDRFVYVARDRSVRIASGRREE